MRGPQELIQIFLKTSNSPNAASGLSSVSTLSKGLNPRERLKSRTLLSGRFASTLSTKLPCGSKSVSPCPA
jgi:hypothetical protein